MWISIFLLLFQPFICCDSIERGWKGIKPLHASQEQVEKILGKGKVNENGYVVFETEEATLRFEFSTVPCRDALYNRGKFNVPERTVLNYTVTLKNASKLSDLKFNRSNYYRDTSGDVKDNILYTSNKDAVWINVGAREGVEYVGTIYYWPNEGDKAKFRCP